MHPNSLSRHIENKHGKSKLEVANLILENGLRKTRKDKKVEHNGKKPRKYTEYICPVCGKGPYQKIWDHLSKSPHFLKGDAYREALNKKQPYNEELKIKVPKVNFPKKPRKHEMENEAIMDNENESASENDIESIDSGDDSSLRIPDPDQSSSADLDRVS